MKYYLVIRDSQHEAYPLIAIVEHPVSLDAETLRSVVQSAYDAGRGAEGDGIFEYVTEQVRVLLGAELTFIEADGEFDFCTDAWDA